MNLSSSSLWQQQQEAYDRLGIYSWAKDQVPFHITNNARIARQYAEIVHRLGKSSCTILELGGGCGKFAYLFLNELQLPCHYIFTDSAAKNVDFCKNHPLFSS